MRHFLIIPARPSSSPALPLVLLFVLLTGLYVASAPALVYQHWDSLEYPHACEARAAKSVWGNHPLGHVVLCGAFRAAVSLGYQGRALPFMRVCNAVIGATTVVTFVWLLGWLGIRRVRAIAWGLVMAGAYGFWLYAGTADIYGLSILAMLGAWIALLAASFQPSARRFAVAGIAVGVAVVTHQFNGTLLLPAFLVLCVAPPAGQPRPRVSDVALLGAIAAVLVLAGYWIIGVLSTGSTSLTDLRPWIVGYGADPTYGRSFNPAGVVKAMWTASDTLLKMVWTPGLALVRLWIVCLVVAAIGLGVVCSFFSRARLRPAALSAVAQLAVGVPLIVWWAPDHVGKWWLLMLPAMVLVQAVGVEVLESGLTRAGVAASRVARAFDIPPILLAAACLGFTGLVTMRAMHRTDTAFDAALDAWAQHTQPGDVTLESDITAHLLFWTDRPNALFIYRTIQASPSDDRFARLREIIDTAIREGRGVYYVPNMVAGFQERDLTLVGVTRESVNAFFDGYARTGPVFTYRPKEGADVREVYRLTGKR